MARLDESQHRQEGSPTGQPAGVQSHVFKARDVHKRRANGKARVKLSELPQVVPSSDADTVEASEPGLQKASASAAVPLSATGEGLTLETPPLVPGNLKGKTEPEQPERLEESAVASGPDAEGQTASRPKKRARIRPKHIAYALVGIIVIVAVGLCSAFAWNRWGRYDDHASMQGEWYIRGTTVPVSIDERAIHLTDEVSYGYEIDDHEKTIQYTFGPLEGQGRYWFSDDRSVLAIIDGEGFTGLGNTLDDLARTIEGIRSANAVVPTGLPQGENVSLLCREPGTLATMAKEAAERALAQAQAKKEREEREAERKAAAEEEAAAQAAEAEAVAAAEAAATEYDETGDAYYYESDSGEGEEYLSEYDDPDNDAGAFEEPVDEGFDG